MFHGAFISYNMVYWHHKQVSWDMNTSETYFDFQSLDALLFDYRVQLILGY